jgi:tRNA (uracil-5-)-methyltransferase TRM9
LNQDFYTTVAGEFDRTRAGLWPGLLRILPYIPTGTKANPVQVLDVGCGNGRYAQILESRAMPSFYTGVDASARLLVLAYEHCAQLVYTRTRFVQANLADPGWPAVLGAVPVFDAVLCLATLHHLPGYELRLNTVQVLRRMLDPANPRAVLSLSAWQFLTTDRLANRRLDWSTVGLSPADVEPGDALLPWGQEGEAVRYVHQIDEAEMQRLARDAGLEIVEMFRSDGREGNLTLYAVLVPGPVGDW